VYGIEIVDGKVNDEAVCVVKEVQYAKWLDGYIWKCTGLLFILTTLVSATITPLILLLLPTCTFPLLLDNKGKQCVKHMSLKKWSSLLEVAIGGPVKKLLCLPYSSSSLFVLAISNDHPWPIPAQSSIFWNFIQIKTSMKGMNIDR
jgi:hypothetical protein